MKNLVKITLLASFALLSTGCFTSKVSQEREDQKAVQEQQAQYSKAQPVPQFDHSLERAAMINLYTLRNKTVSTFTVWRSDMGVIEGYCPSMGFGIPYDMSLTNPLQMIHGCKSGGCGVTSIGQAEPNGVFSSQNTSATWAMCINSDGSLAPHYIESKVTVYPCTLVDLPEDNQGPVLCNMNAKFIKLDSLEG